MTVAVYIPVRLLVITPLVIFNNDLGRPFHLRRLNAQHQGRVANIQCPTAKAGVAKLGFAWINFRLLKQVQPVNRYSRYRGFTVNASASFTRVRYMAKTSGMTTRFSVFHVFPFN